MEIEKTKETKISKLNKHKFVVFCTIICGYFVICLIPFLVLGIGHGALEKAYFISQIVSGIFVIAGVAVALIQYLSNNEELVGERRRQSIIKAAELADEYCHEIIPYSNQIAQLYSDGKLEKILGDVQRENLTMFNKEEMEEKFGKGIFDIWFKEAVSQYAREHKLKMDQPENIKKAIEATAEFFTNFSNRLESMCIKLNTGIADEATVYQSLHSDFLKNVQMLYFILSFSNENESERSYSNVRDNYRKWDQISRKMRQKEENEAAEFQKEQRKKKEEFGEQFIRREKIKK